MKQTHANLISEPMLFYNWTNDHPKYPKTNYKRANDQRKVEKTNDYGTNDR